MRRRVREPLREADAIKCPRHIYIGEDEVDWTSALHGQTYGVVRILGINHLIAQILQHQRQRLPKQSIVLDHQDEFLARVVCGDHERCFPERGGRVRRRVP
jgi:hypothetical protein